MIIEMCGFPGSGKTYAVSQIRSDNLVVMETKEMYQKSMKLSGIKRNIKNIKFVLFNPILVLCLFFYILTIFSKEGIKRYWQLLRYFAIYDYIAKNADNGKVILLDQGLVQFIWSLVANNKHSGIKESLLLKMSIKRVRKMYNLNVIYYKVETDLAAKRAAIRKGTCPLDKLGYDVISKLYKVHKDDFDVLMNYLSIKDRYIAETAEDVAKIVIDIKLNRMENKDTQ